MRPVALLTLLAISAAASDVPRTEPVGQDDPVVVAVKTRLSQDEAARGALADRLEASRLAGFLSTETRSDARRDAIREWIESEPDSAARIAIGLAADEKNGDTLFEDALLRETLTTYERNPGADKNVFGRLTKAARDSKLIRRQAEELDEDERREILRTLFEGKGAPGEKAVSFAGLSDRLNGENLRGYSPQLLSLQNSLNAHRPPGAPRLAETGRLDHETLSFPRFAIRHDLDALEDRLRRDGIAPRAASARRAAFISKARKAAGDFEAAAAKSKDPAAITRGLLLELSRDQREAARWIAMAALEEELSQLDADEGFLTPETLSLIDSAPVSAEIRAAYRAQGERLESRRTRARSHALRAQELLESGAWTARLAEVDRLVAANRSLRRDLRRDIDLFTRLPRLIQGSRLVQPRWREILERLARRLAPRTAFARASAARRDLLTMSLSAFTQVAAGDLEPAARTLDARR